MSAKKEKKLRKVVGKVVKKTGTTVAHKLKTRIAYLSVVIVVSVAFNAGLIWLLVRKA